MADLKTDYKDDVLDTTQNTKRKYQMIDNGDGTVSFEDVTKYIQQGDSFGADDTNATNTKVNALESDIDEINDKLTLKELASVTTASGKTFRQALLELKTTWDTLTTDEKANTTLYYGNSILCPNNTTGIYSRVTLTTSELIIFVFKISAGEALFYSNGTITNKTDVALDANLSLKGF